MAFGADRTVKVNLTANVSDYLGKLAAAQKATGDFAKTAGASATKNKADWERVGKGLLVVGAAAAAGVGLAVKRFADFDAAMSAAAAGTNATTLELASLRQAAIKAGADTMFSATEAANAITEMGKAGVSTKDILSGGLIGAMSLAAAGQLEVGRAGEIAAVAMTQFGLSGKDIPHIADVLSAGAGKAMGSVEDLGTAFEQVAPIAASMGFSIEETTGVLAEFAQAGLKGEKGGTGLRSVLLSLSAPSKQAKEEIDKLGISIYDSQGKTKSAAAIAGQLSKALGTQTDAEKNAALGRIFGNEAMAAATVLYKGGSTAVEDWTAKVNDSGFAAEQARKLTDNLKGDIERLGGSIDSVLIQGAGGANGPLRGMVQGLEKVVNGFGNLGPAGSQAAFGLTAVTAAAALAGGAALTAVPKIQAMRASLATLQVSASKAGAAVGYAAAAVTQAVVAFGAAEGALVLGSFIGQSQVASVETNKLAIALGNLGDNVKNADFRKLFVSQGEFASNVATSEEALKRFGVTAYSALDEGWDARLGRIQDFGAEQARFTKETNQMDGALAQMVRSGNADGAAKAMEELLAAAKAAGAPVDKTRAAFKLYDAALKETTAANEQAIVAVDKTTGAAISMADALGGAVGDANALGSAMSLLGAGAKVTDQAVKDLAKTIQGDMDAASKAFTSDLDVLSKYDPAAAADKSKAAQETLKSAEQNLADLREQLAGKGKMSVRDTQRLRDAQTKAETASAKTRGAALQKYTDLQAQLATKGNRTVREEQQLRDATAKVEEARAAASKARAVASSSGLEQAYQASIKAGKTFAKEIGEVTRRGLDPQVVAKLLQEGPEKAAPALQALLGKHSTQMIQMVNESEAALAKVNQTIVEQSRLTSMAVNSGTDKMGADLDVAMQIAAAKAANGGRITAEALAKQLKLKVPEVQQIATEFGIAIEKAPPPKPIPIKANGSAAMAEARAVQRELDALHGVVLPITIDVAKTRVADEHARRENAANSNTAGTNLDLFNGKHLATGGPVAGPGTGTSDSIPAYLSNGEYVIKAASVAKYGSHFFDKLNSMRFASGGFVGSSQSVSTHTDTTHAPVYIDKVMGVTIADVEAEAERRRRTAALRGL